MDYHSPSLRSGELIRSLRGSYNSYGLYIRSYLQWILCKRCKSIVISFKEDISYTCSYKEAARRSEAFLFIPINTIRLLQSTIRLLQSTIRLLQSTIRLLQSTIRLLQSTIRLLQRVYLSPRSLLHISRSLLEVSFSLLRVYSFIFY